MLVADKPINSAAETPTAMFRRSSVPTTLHGSVKPRRLKRSADWIEDADAIGAEVTASVRTDGLTRYTWTRKGYTSPPVYRTVGEAARAVGIHAGLSSYRTARCAFIVQPWLAEALKRRGEIICKRYDGRSLWGCTDPEFNPEHSAVICDVFAHTSAELRG